MPSPALSIKSLGCRIQSAKAAARAEPNCAILLLMAFATCIVVPDPELLIAIAAGNLGRSRSYMNNAGRSAPSFQLKCVRRSEKILCSR
jgi:hypothetical protein